MVAYCAYFSTLETLLLPLSEFLCEFNTYSTDCLDYRHLSKWSLVLMKVSVPLGCIDMVICRSKNMDVKDHTGQIRLNAFVAVEILYSWNLHHAEI